MQDKLFFVSNFGAYSHFKICFFENIFLWKILDDCQFDYIFIANQQSHIIRSYILKGVCHKRNAI